MGPLTTIDLQDDTDDDPFGGPFGDPRFTRVLDGGTYSILVGMYSPDTGGAFTVESFVIHPHALTTGLHGPYFAPHRFAGPPSGGSWFTFTVPHPSHVDIDINRTAAPPDLDAMLYRGDVTGQLDSISPDGLINGLYSYETFGPITGIAYQDDTEDDPFGGPWGDPRFQMDLGVGTYSLLVSSRSPVEGGSFTVTALFGDRCGNADLSPQYGVLDLSDITAFISAFLAQDPLADLSIPYGVFDLSDITAFVNAFTVGCP
jgi:hypothetical protein